MNKQRREALLRIADDLESVKNDLVSVREEEQEAFDNLPESLQYSARGDAMQEAVSEMDDIESDIDDLIGRISELCE